MLKMLILIVGLAGGFGIGVWWGVHHPDQAATLSAEEEKKFLEAQMKVTQAMKDKLDQLMSKKTKTPGSGFLASGSAPDPAVVELRNAQDQQLKDLQSHIDKIKAK